MGGGVMGGGRSQRMGSEERNIKVAIVPANADGTQVTASLEILSSAVSDTRQIRLDTGQGEVVGMVSGLCSP